MTNQTPEWPGENFVKNRILARIQSEEGVEKINEVVDTLSKVRGKGMDFDCSLSDIAEELGMSGNAYPQDSAAKAVKRAANKFVRNFYLTIVTESMIKSGTDEESAFEFAMSAWAFNTIELERDPSDVLREVLYYA